MTSQARRDHNKSQIIFACEDRLAPGEPQTMYLQTFKKPRHVSLSKNFSLRTDDIEGAQAKPRNTSTRQTFYTNADLPFSSPKQHVDLTKPPKDILNISDIQGASPIIHRNLPHSHRHVNPLNPDYPLSSFPTNPVEEKKFIRDPIDISDLPGAHPKRLFSSVPVRNPLKIDDIPGTRPKVFVDEKKEPRFHDDLKEITSDGKFKTSRIVDPLMPEYYIYSETLPNDFGYAVSSYKTRNGETDMILKTQDIQGAQADTATEFYRKFKPSMKEEVGDRLNLPSMKKAEMDILLQRKADETRGERIRRMENRLVGANENDVDPVQGQLRRQRRSNRDRGYNIITNL